MHLEVYPLCRCDVMRENKAIAKFRLSFAGRTPWLSIIGREFSSLDVGLPEVGDRRCFVGGRPGDLPLGQGLAGS